MDDGAIRDMFESLGPVDIRRIFGGKGIYVNDVIVALEYRGDVLLKADAETVEEFRQAGSTQWTYKPSRSDRLAAMPYWSIPESALDDPEEMSKWARLAYDAGLRASKRTSVSPRRRSS